MNKMTAAPLVAIGIFLLSAGPSLWAVPASASGAQEVRIQLPAGEGREEVRSFCTACHDLERVVNQRKGEEAWRATVLEMLSRVSSQPGGEVDLITGYLAEHFGAAPSDLLGQLRTLLESGEVARAEELTRGNRDALREELAGILHEMDRGFDELGRQKARYDLLREKFLQFDATWLPNEAVFEIFSRVAGEPSYLKNFQAKRLRVEGAKHTTSADHFWDLQDYRRALEEYSLGISKLKEAIPLAEQAGNGKLVAACLTNIGYNEIYSGNHLEGLENYSRAMKSAEEREDVIFQGMYSLNLSTYYLYTHQAEQALPHAQRAAEINRETGRRTWEANSLLNVGSAYFSLGRYEEADSYLQKGLLKAQEVKDRRSHGRILFNLALVKSQFGRKREAADLMERALKWYEENEIVYGLAEQILLKYQGLQFLAAASRELGDPEKSADYLAQVERLREEDPQRLAAYLADPHLNFLKWDSFKKRLTLKSTPLSAEG